MADNPVPDKIEPRAVAGNVASPKIVDYKIDLRNLAAELLDHGVGQPWFQRETRMRQEKLLEEWLAEEIGE